VTQGQSFSLPLQFLEPEADTVSPAMRWLRLIVLVLLTLCAMRAGSWILGWILSKLSRAGARCTLIASNTLAFLVFVGLLFWNLYPGEPLDISAVIFAAVVYGICGFTDLYWRPWKSHA
jgi:hypothetical protein